MKQTAVEFLVEKLCVKQFDSIYVSDNLNDISGIIEQAKEMEKQQIIDARVNAPLLNTEYKSDYVIEAEQYYNQTFGKSTFWYDEDQTTERMNIIGQNGNDGIHYDE